MPAKTLTDFNTLVDEYYREIFAYLWRMLRHTDDAEDCLQETFLRAFRGFPHLREDSNPRAWLYKIATNAAYTQLKRRRQHESRITEPMSAIALEGISPIDKISQKELVITVLQAVETLPYKQRAALMMRNYQGLRYDEIAEILDCSSDSARANVYQAVKKLRIQFAEDEK